MHGAMLLKRHDLDYLIDGLSLTFFIRAWREGVFPA